MTVNTSKSMKILICLLESLPRFINPLPPEISVSTLKLLVMCFSNLKWNIHVEHIIHRASASISLLRLLINLVSPIPFLKAYISFAQPTLEYACPVWHPGISQKESEKK